MKGPLPSRVGLALLVLVAACSAERDGGTEPPPKVEDSLEWMDGSDGTHVLIGENDIMRCWPLLDRFDCLYASVFDIQSDIADSPVKRTYYRVRLDALPVRRSDMDSLEGGDGYVCDASQQLGGTFFTEMILKQGQVVAETRHVSYDWSARPWMSGDVDTLLRDNAIVARRPYFNCVVLDEAVAKSGLIAIDSALVTYARIMQVDALPSPSNAN